MKRIKEIQKRFFNKLLISKAGRVAEAFRTIKGLPEIVDQEKRRKALRFKKELSSFINRILRKSFNAYRTELGEGQAVKKKAVIQLINTTMVRQKNIFNRWFNITDRMKLLEQCKQVGNMFSTINYAIKKVAGNAFNDNKYSIIKEMTLTQLIKKLSANVGASFYR